MQRTYIEFTSHIKKYFPLKITVSFVFLFFFSILTVIGLIIFFHHIVKASTQSYSTTILADNPSVYYRLGETSGPLMIDKTANNRTGSYNSTGVSYNQPGGVTDGDTAVSGTGKGYIGEYIQGNGLPLSSSPRSAEIWFKSNSIPPSYGGALIAWGTETGTQLFSMKLYSSTRIKLTNWNTDYYYSVPSNTNMLDGKWHYAVSTFDGTNSTVYIDGINIGTQKTTFTTVLNTSKGLVLGAQMGTNNSNYSGSIDEAAVYNYVLSASQIDTHYTTGLGTIVSATPPPSPTPTFAPGPLSDGNYLYAFTDGFMYVYNMKNGFSFVKQKPIPTTDGTRGVAVDPTQHMVYISHGSDSSAPGYLLKYDLLTDQIVWNMSYNHGIDSMAITPDGTKIYMPQGELSSGGKWYIVNTTDGSELTTSLDTNVGTGDNGPHNTVVSMDGQYVYMGDRNYNNPGSNYFYVGSTISNTIINKVGPFANGIRPFTVNNANTLVYTSVTNMLGFQVGSLTTAAVLYTVPITKPSGASCTNSGATDPSHGITLSPDEKNVYVIDYTCNYIHQFDVSNVPTSAPIQVADIPITPFNPSEKSCAYDCLGDGWLLHSLDGQYVIVGDSGSIINTATNTLVPPDTSLTGFSTILYNTRKFIEVDWQCGTTTATTTRHGLGRAGFPTPTPQICPTSIPTNTPTPTNNPTPTELPTPIPTPTTSPSTYKNAVLGDNPLFYYRLDEKTGIPAIDSAGNHTGTYQSNVQFNQPGATNDSNTAILANGLSVKYAAGTGLPLGSTPRSVEFWFKTTATPAAPYGSTFLSWGSGSTNQMFGAKIYQDANHLFYIKLTNWTASYLYLIPSGQNPLDGKWHYVVATFDGTNSTVYYDSQNIGSQTTSYNTILNANGLYLGLQSPNNAYPFNGSFDEAAIYNYALTSSQVQNHYSSR